MDTFIDNAQKIFEVARQSGSAEMGEFALLVCADGGLQMVMNSQVSLAAAIDSGASTAYRVTRSLEGVRVAGRTGDCNCVLEERGSRSVAAGLLRDQPLYRIESPLLTSAALS